MSEIRTLETGLESLDSAKTEPVLGNDTSLRTTTDTFLGGAVSLHQPVNGYRAGLDAVLLAASVVLAVSERDAATSEPARTPRIADLGAGVGAVGLCLAARLPSAAITLVEREPALADLCRLNAAPMAERTRVVEADITAVALNAALPDRHFDQVVANPPFYSASSVCAPASPLKAASHIWQTGDLDAWVRTAARITRPGGLLTLIHPADGLEDILAVLAGRFGNIQVTPIHPFQEAPAIRVIVRAKAGRRGRLELRPPLILHETDTRAFRQPVAAVLTAPNGLNLWG